MTNYPTFETIGERVLWLRRRRKLTQEQLGEACGQSREWVAKIERGNTRMPRKIKELANALGVSPAWLQFGIEEIDNLSKEILEAAIDLEKLPEDKRKLVLELIQNLKR